MNSKVRDTLVEGVVPSVVALMIALVVGDILILVFGESPLAVYRLLLEGTWGNAYGLGQVLYKATTLIFTGLAVAIGVRAGLFNIAAESQLAAGGFAAAMTGLLLPATVPAVVAIPLCMLAAMAAGGLLGGVPGVLKARFGAHEVIVTIMLNFIVLALLSYLISAHFHVPESLHTEEIRTGSIPRLTAASSYFAGSAANFTIIVALIAAAAVWVLLFRTRVPATSCVRLGCSRRPRSMVA